MAKVRPPKISALLHTGDRSQPRLNDASQVVADFIRLQNVEVKLRYAEANCESGRHDVDDRISASGGRSPRTWLTFELISESALLES
jgi:hypothetical protein